MSDTTAEALVTRFLAEKSGWNLAFWRSRLDGPAAAALRSAPAPVQAEAAVLLAQRAPDDPLATQLASLLLAGHRVLHEGSSGRNAAPLAGAGAPTWLALQPADHRAAWSALLQHAATSAGKARPSGRWGNQAAALVATIGTEAFVERLIASMEAVPLGVRKVGWSHVPELEDREQDVLKGLIWAAAGLGSEGLAHAVARFAERCFRKIPDHGAASTRLGNACLYTLGALPDGSGVAHLSRLGARVRYASARRLVDAALTAAAAQAGITPQDLEELSVPTFGLADGASRRAFGDFEAALAIEGGEAVLRWTNAAGKPQKSVPKAVKEAFPDELKALVRQHKELRDLLAAQPARLERSWLADRRLPFADARARYLDHPVVGTVARRLLWRAETDAGPLDFLWREARTGSGFPVFDEDRRGHTDHAGGGGWLAERKPGTHVGSSRQAGDGRAIGLAGAVDVPEDAETRLWHLLDVAAPDDDEAVEEVLVWRDLLEQHAIVQPFAQLWREVYAPEHPEARESRRFAGHVVRQHVLRSVLQVRGWRYALQGMWDSHNWPDKAIPGTDWTVQLAIDPVEHRADDFAFQYVLVGGVQFFRHGTQAPLGEVPPRLFSEVLRDVDLLVSSASVANDPDFDPTGIGRVWSDYWRENAFGPLAPIAGTRRAVLQRILPRTRLRDVARIEGPDLVVQGPKGMFRVHIGSARIRGPSGDPVVVAPDRKAKDAVRQVLLPFEGDGVVTDLLAKGFFLAE